MNKIKRKIFNILREIVKRKITNNLGKVVEDDEKIVCYVKRRKIKNRRFRYTIACHGIGKREKELASIYKINKPICYVIDGLEFKKKKVNIWGYNGCEIIVKNCRFDFDLDVNVNGKCTIDDCFIMAFDNLSIGAKELIIKNMDIKNQLFLAGVNLQIFLGGNEKLEINNSNIGCEKEKTKVFLIARDEIGIYRSKIAGDMVECKSDKIIAGKKSLLSGTEKVVVNANKFYEINIDSPKIVYNDNEIEIDRRIVVLKRNTDPLKIKRREFIEFLKQLRDECENLNKEELDTYSKYLNNREITKVLKKENKGLI